MINHELELGIALNKTISDLQRVQKQLVEALEMILEDYERYGCVTEVDPTYEFAKAALAAAKETM